MERIGIIRSLYYYETGALWEDFFTQLGYELVRSEPADETSLDVSEACQPIRNCLLHVQNLLDRHVKYIFLPRVISYRKGYCACPKIQGICDVVRTGTSNVTLIEPVIDVKAGRYDSAYQIGQQLGIPAGAARYVYREVSRRRPVQIQLPEQPYVVVLGHPYVLEDPVMGRPVLEYLTAKKIRVVTAENVPDEALLQKAAAAQSRKMFWYTGQKLIGLCRTMLERLNPPQGILFLSAFGCGIDDFIWPVCERLTKGRVPFLHLTLDRQYQDTGMMTRLEAFEDMLERKGAAS